MHAKYQHLQYMYIAYLDGMYDIPEGQLGCKSVSMIDDWLVLTNLVPAINLYTTTALKKSSYVGVSGGSASQLVSLEVGVV